MNEQERLDRVDHVLRVVGDEIGLRTLTVGGTVVRRNPSRWSTPSRLEIMEQERELDAALKEDGVYELMRQAAEEYYSRRPNNREHRAAYAYGNLYETLLGILSGPPLTEFFDRRIETYTRMRRALSQPAPRPTAKAAV